ncbi:hypothetical protein GJ629_02100 [Halapricum sp. CBA1109]|uniref:hypothetical protein n=1 Tax=Halapricum sp. CBA1109 TaxID=2668068 RepID=UPI0012F77F34|nr:hypothetical protein [Halapricum sp. CBA1109]MUV88831.1 hypothetical protein [Halapricum sp. CBA1109]
MDHDWDVLTILDACRYDTFREMSDLPGELAKRESIQCSTGNVLRGQFDGEVWHDTVYVTAMPVLYNGQQDQLIDRDPIQTEFHCQIEVWDKEGWDDKFNTVLPEKTLEYALSAAERFPDKRLILHFSQPHCPFIGETGREHYPPNKRDIWRDVLDGTTDTTHIWNAYRENLASVLPVVETILDEIEGKHIVTADHGQALGDRAYPVPMREWGHPPGIYIDEIVEVPWLSYQNGERREIVTAPPVEVDDDHGEAVVRDRLADLGYVD